MPKETMLSLVIEINFDLTQDSPESSGLMSKLRKEGFEQNELGGTPTKLTYKGKFTGSVDKLIEFCQSIK